jgi:hypothetical protein
MRAFAFARSETVVLVASVDLRLAEEHAPAKIDPGGERTKTCEPTARCAHIAIDSEAILGVGSDGD